MGEDLNNLFEEPADPRPVLVPQQEEEQGGVDDKMDETRKKIEKLESLAEYDPQQKDVAERHIGRLKQKLGQPEIQKKIEKLETLAKNDPTQKEKCEKHIERLRQKLNE